MKQLITIAITFLSFLCDAQKTETFYDFNWTKSEPGNARFYSTIEKTDSGWLRRDYYINSRILQMQALYADSDCKILNGTGMWFHPNGMLSSIGRSVNNKKVGTHMRFHSNGMLADSAYYDMGVRNGPRIMLYRNGFMSDSINSVNDSMNVHISWYEDGAPAQAGYFLYGERHGKWVYHFRTGTIAGYEVYNKGKKLSQEYFNVDGTPHPDTSDVNMDATFKKGGSKGWSNYLNKAIHWPQGLELANTKSVTIGISFTINEEGKPEDVEIYVPFHPAFEEIAIRVIKNSPPWKPCLSKNRLVKQGIKQPLTFVQTD